MEYLIILGIAALIISIAIGQERKKSKARKQVVRDILTREVNRKRNRELEKTVKTKPTHEPVKTRRHGRTKYNDHGSATIIFPVDVDPTYHIPLTPEPEQEKPTFGGGDFGGGGVGRTWDSDSSSHNDSGGSHDSGGDSGGSCDSGGGE